MKNKPTEKYCPGCCEAGEKLPGYEFMVDYTSPDGLFEMCVECMKYAGIVTIEPKESSTAFLKEKHAMPKTKVCPKCEDKTPQPLENFYPRKDSKDGRQAVCKKCKKKYQSGYQKDKNVKVKKILAQEFSTMDLIRAKLSKVEFIGFLRGIGIGFFADGLIDDAAECAAMIAREVGKNRNHIAGNGWI